MENEYEVQRSLGRIEGSIIELKSDLRLFRDDFTGLRTEFNQLEAGRLTKLESAFAVSQAQIHTKARSIAMWTGGLISVVVSVITALIIKYLI